MNKEHIHKYKDTGSGTAFKDGLPDYSEVTYECECGSRIRLYLPTEKYLERVYFRTMLIEELDSREVLNAKINSKK